MNSASQIADEIIQFVAARVNVTLGTREDIRRLIVAKVLPLTPVQPALNFESDKDALEGQSAAILALLKERRSSGALNHELAELSLKYTSRLSDLRAAGYRIECVRESGRTFRYVLAATDW